MAQEYKIIYTFSGQGNNGGNRSVAFSKFTASGDTDKFIGQITSITYEHVHTSTSARTWSLRGRLIFGDGTVLDSNIDTQRIAGESVKFINTFPNLPDADMLPLLTTVQTLNEKDSINNDGYSAKLYWRATSSQPIRLIITFIEQPPIYFDPSVKAFSVQRCNSDGLPDDEAEHLATTLRLGIGLKEGLEQSELRVYYAANAYPIAGESEYIDLSSRIPELLEGAALNPTIIPGEWDVGSSWYFMAVFIAGEESAAAMASAPRAKGSLHISGEPCGGVAICGYSTGTTAEPKFECYAKAYFYGGIEGMNEYHAGEVRTGEKWIDGKDIYRYILVGTSTADGSVEVIGYMPSSIDTLIKSSGTVARSDGTMSPMPYAYHGSSAWTATYYIGSESDNRKIEVQFGSEYNGTKHIVLIFEYTKKE